jgi:hypothetical protein
MEQCRYLNLYTNVQCEVLISVNKFALCGLHESERFNERLSYKRIADRRFEYVSVALRNDWPVNSYAVVRLLKDEILCRRLYKRRYQLPFCEWHEARYSYLNADLRRYSENIEHLIHHSNGIPRHSLKRLAKLSPKWLDLAQGIIVNPKRIWERTMNIDSFEDLMQLVPLVAHRGLHMFITLQQERM